MTSPKKEGLGDLLQRMGTTSSSVASSSAQNLGLGAPQYGLSGIFGRPHVQGLYYNSKTITLDGYEFVGCRFDNCILRVSSTNFDLKSCVIDAATRIEFGEPVTRIIRLFLGRYQWSYTLFDSWFTPTRNADGSQTISKRT